MPGKRGGGPESHDRANKAWAELKAAREKLAREAAEKAAARKKADDAIKAANEARKDKRYGP